MLDVVIRGGEVVDGTGAPRRRADVGIRDGRIVAVGDVDEPARRTFEAAGRIVAPGFIDVHTHLDVQLFWDPTLSPSSLHGVTTVMAGNCGFSVAPLAGSESDYLMRMLARVEGMPLEALETSVPWDWSSSEEYFDRVRQVGPAVNMGFMVGHSALRRVVMGNAGTERHATAEELEAMAELLRAGLRAGGMGFSSSWATAHNDGDGNPVPSRHGNEDELIRLAGVCGEFEGTSIEFLPQAGDRDFTEESIELMANMSAAARRPLNWNVIKPDVRNREFYEQRLTASDVARARGGKVVGLVMPVRTPIAMTFRTGVVLDMLPGWAKLMSAPPEVRLAALREPQERRRLAELAATPSAASHLADWADRVILETFTPEAKRYEGRVVGDIAAEDNKDPFDVLLDIACSEDLRTTFTFNRPPVSAADWDVKIDMIRDSRTLIGGSDAGAHLDLDASYDYPTRCLSEAVRERQLLSVEELIWRITELPAQLYGLRDRGHIEEGMHADIVIFDEERVGSDPYETRFDLPQGAGRLYAAAVGIDHVLVNGEEIVRDGEVTDARPGTVLRSGIDTTTPSLN
jgi:N-acyl-D-aspartate/D-glutamate deacylase